MKRKWCKTSGRLTVEATFFYYFFFIFELLINLMNSQKLLFCSGLFIIYSADYLKPLAQASKSIAHLWIDDLYVTGILKVAWWIDQSIDQLIKSIAWSINWPIDWSINQINRLINQLIESINYSHQLEVFTYGLLLEMNEMFVVEKLSDRRSCEAWTQIEEENKYIAHIAHAALTYFIGSSNQLINHQTEDF